MPPGAATSAASSAALPLPLNPMVTLARLPPSLFIPSFPPSSPPLPSPFFPPSLPPSLASSGVCARALSASEVLQLLTSLSSLCLPAALCLPPAPSICLCCSSLCSSLLLELQQRGALAMSAQMPPMVISAH